MIVEPAGPGAVAVFVGAAEMAVARADQGPLVAYALGSCVGVSVHDPVARVGGMLHFLLPRQPEGRASRRADACAFAATGLPMLFARLLAAGARLSRCVACAAGGAEMLENPAAAALGSIGSRNCRAVTEVCAAAGVALAATATGGPVARTLRLCVATGEVLVRSQLGLAVLWPPGRLLDDAATAW